jgi:hypothetical protein
LVVKGSEGGTREWNSPWLERDAGLPFADILGLMEVRKWEMGVWNIKERTEDSNGRETYRNNK